MQASGDSASGDPWVPTGHRNIARKQTSQGRSVFLSKAGPGERPADEELRAKQLKEKERRRAERAEREARLKRREEEAEELLADVLV
jgi:hypothetical protein